MVFTSEAAGVALDFAAFFTGFFGGLDALPPLANWPVSSHFEPMFVDFRLFSRAFSGRFRSKRAAFQLRSEQLSELELELFRFAMASLLSGQEMRA